MLGITIFSSLYIPLGMLISAYPYKVFTFNLPPKRAWDKFIFLVTWISTPCLEKYGWGLTFIFINRSPGSPLDEKLPFLLSLRLTPESTPLGIVMVSFT